MEVKLLYGKDIRAFNFFQPLSIYVVASISSTDPDKNLDQTQKQRTPTDKEGDGSPEWNHELRFDLKGIPLHGDGVFLRIDLLHEGGMFGDRQIGEVRVPLSNFLEHVDGIVRVVSYQVKGPDGKPNGALTLCYKINGVGGESDCSIVQHHHHRIQGSIELEKPPQEIIRYPTLGRFDYSVLALSSSCYPPPETYYSPPPPAPPAAVVYPAPSHPAVWPPSPAVYLHHHHHYHHHHHSWSHFPYRDDGGQWRSFDEGEVLRRDPYASPR